MKFRSASEARTLGAPLVRLFVTGLARAPSPFELAPLLERLRAGDDLGDAAAAMAASSEFLARHGPHGPADRHYIRALFWAIDGQDPPEAETARLLGQPKPSRGSLLAQVSQSATARAAITLERNFYGGALPPDDDVAYQLWLDAGGEQPLRFTGPIPPVSVSIVVAAPAARPDLLDATLGSLAAQSSPHWEALVVSAVARPPALADTRVRVIPGQPTTEALMRAAAQASGSLVGFIEAGDELAPSALEAASRLFAARPGLRLIYTDEDRIAGDCARSAVLLKSGWSPDLLLSGDVLGQLVLFQRQVLLAAGGLTAAAGDFALLDAALRVTHDASPDQVAHQPGILFHRGRAQSGRPEPFPTSRASNGIPQLDAVVDRFLATHRPGLQRGARTEGSRVWPSVTAQLPAAAPLVSVIIPTRDRASLLERCVSGLLDATDYPAIEVLIVDNGSTEADALALLGRLAADRRVRVLHDASPFNWSALTNLAAEQATGEVLLLLNNDISVVHPGWLRSMVGHAMRPGTGVVGARLLFPDGRLQHGGVLLGPHGAAVHALTGAAGDDPGYLAQVMVLRDLSAVTGACLAIRRALFHELGGLEQDHLRVAWSDIDLCLRAREAGHRVLWDPEATLVHHEMATRGQDVSLQQQARHEVERAYMRRRWPAATEHDPFLNPALRADPDRLALRPAAAAEATGPDMMEKLQTEIAGLKRALHRSEKDAERLRGLWPRAELQRLYLDAAERTAELARLTQRAAALSAALAGVPGYVLAFGRRLAVLPRIRWVIRRLAGAVRRTPERRRLLRQRRADYAVIAASPAFDRAWYRATAMDNDTGTDPVAHYLWKGWVAGRQPHPLFDAAWYAARTPALGTESAFANYLRRGMAADEDPHPLFDAAYYVAQAPDAAGRALLHHMGLPPGDTRSPAPLFDPADYQDGLEHWIRVGAAENRDPHALFATAWYRRTHLGGDPSRDPLAHWIREGRASGLPPNPYGLDPATTRLPSPDPTTVASIIVEGGRSTMETTRTLLSVAQNSAPVPYEVILVGAEATPRHGDGLRFAKDRTAAAASARGRHLVLLGAGTVAHPGWLAELLETVGTDPGLAMVGCKTLNADGSLRSAGAAVSQDGQVRHDADGDPALPQHAFCRMTDAVDPAAMLVRRDAWDTLGGFDDAYQADLFAAADFAFALRARGWRTVVQPAAIVTAVGGAPSASQADLARFRQRWASTLSRQPAPGDPLAGWRAASRRVLVLADGIPAQGGFPVADAIGRLLQPGTRAVLHALDGESPNGAAACWERLGLEILRSPVLFDEWLAVHGALLDEVWSFRAPADVPGAMLLRATGAALLQWEPGCPLPAWCDGALDSHTLDARAAA